MRPEWLPAGGRVAPTAGASTPEVLVGLVLDRLWQLGARSVQTVDGIDEVTTFRLPAELDRPTAR